MDRVTLQIAIDRRNMKDVFYIFLFILKIVAYLIIEVSVGTWARLKL